MLQLLNICKSYTTADFTQTALDNVSVSFRDNEFVAILGPSGSGKTTLLNIVGGLDHYDSGNLIIDGISTEQYKDKDWDAYRNNRIGFVFQSYNLIPHQTVLSNVELALTLSGVSRAERHDRAVAALQQVGLGDHVNKKPSQLSGGQMQRVAIARALINDPEIPPAPSTPKPASRSWTCSPRSRTTAWSSWSRTTPSWPKTTQRASSRSPTASSAPTPTPTSPPPRTCA